MTSASNDENLALPRSPEMMNPQDTGLLVVDVQQRLLTVIPDRERIVWNIRRLLDAARLLGVPQAGSEQVPEKLGGTEATLAERLDEIDGKSAFSCGECGGIFARWRGGDRHRVLLCGIETHVCVAQTAFDLLADGFHVYLAVDATGTRHAIDHEVALRRMESAGVTLTTTEAAMFEWCRIAGTPEFRQISTLAKESAP